MGLVIDSINKFVRQAAANWILIWVKKLQILHSIGLHALECLIITHTHTPTPFKLFGYIKGSKGLTWPETEASTRLRSAAGDLRRQSVIMSQWPLLMHPNRIESNQIALHWKLAVGQERKSICQ